MQTAREPYIQSLFAERIGGALFGKEQSMESQGAVEAPFADEHPRIKKTTDGYVLDTSLEQLAKLQPAFRKGGIWLFEINIPLRF